MITLRGHARQLPETTPLTDTQREILTAVDVVPPPRITALKPA